MARIADDTDFEKLKRLLDDMEGWSLEINKPDTKVWTKGIEGCSFHMVKIHTFFDDIPSDTL